jgi:hypothetical protein
LIQSIKIFALVYENSRVGKHTWTKQQKKEVESKQNGNFIDFGNALKF